MASCSSCLMISICFSSSVSSCSTEVFAVLRDSAFPLVVKEGGVSLLPCGRGMSWCWWTVTSFCPSSVQMYFFRWQLPRLAVFHTACWLFPTWALNRERRVNTTSEPCVCAQHLPCEPSCWKNIGLLLHITEKYYSFIPGIMFSCKAQIMNANDQIFVI